LVFIDEYVAKILPWMESARFSETLVHIYHTRTTLPHIPEESNLHTHHPEKLGLIKAECLADVSGYKMVTNHSSVIKTAGQHRFNILFWHTVFSWGQRLWTFQLRTLAICFWVVPQGPKSHYQSQFVLPQAQFFINLKECSSQILFSHLPCFDSQTKYRANKTMLHQSWIPTTV
jgi:hypothetical protein